MGEAQLFHDSSPGIFLWGDYRCVDDFLGPVHIRPAAGAVLDTAALTLSSIDIPYETSAALCIRAGFLALRSMADYFDISYPRDPHYPTTPISVKRGEYDALMDKLHDAGLPIKADREQAWNDFAGWRVNYDRVLLVLCTLVMAPPAPWSSDCMPKFRHPPLFYIKKKKGNYSASGATKLGRNGVPTKASLKAARALTPFLRAVERHPRMLQKFCAPEIERKPPETFCLIFIMRKSRSA